MARVHVSERRTEDLVRDLLRNQGWLPAKPPRGQTVRQNELRNFPGLKAMFTGASKTGPGDGAPDFLCLDTAASAPLMVIETKGEVADVDAALEEACHYGGYCAKAGFGVVAVGVAGQEDDFAVRVCTTVGDAWVDVTSDGNPVSWLPTPDDVGVLVTSTKTELTPTVPAQEVLAARADVINRILRESGVRDQYRPAYVGAMMLALWKSRGSLRKTDPRYVLRDVNVACGDAFTDAGKASLAPSLAIDEANDRLAARAYEILAELEKLNVVTASFSHDYLGYLYEAFFRYTGGNTIGQFFTPRHIARMMADLIETSGKDLVIDPACGTGGFLIAALQRAKDVGRLSYRQTVDVVRDNLLGYEQEPTTAALCVANMILRGDGKSGIRQGDVFKAKDYPDDTCSAALMNPPFPHKKTDTPPTQFVDKALAALHKRGKLAVILPTSLVAKKQQPAQWRRRILKDNSLVAVVQLPDELFQPYAAATTSVVILEKGVPHDLRREVAFVRLKHDGYALKKGTRVVDPAHPSQVAEVVDAVLNKRTVPGFSGVARLADTTDEWTVGAHIPTAAPAADEMESSVDELLRRLSSFYVRYAAEIANQRKAIAAGAIRCLPYREMVSSTRLKNSDDLPRAAGTIGEKFDIYYGLKELHSRDGIAPGDTLVISPTEEYNGCYGWLTFPAAIEAPFVTVAQTGSIGEAFVQTEPCAVNDDCLVLLPRPGQAATVADLVIAASAIRLERWRFNYGRKLTPQRIAGFRMPDDAALRARAAREHEAWSTVAEAAVALYP